MAKELGNQGKVKISTNQVAEVISFSLERSSGSVDGTTLSDTSRQRAAGIKDWRGSVECFYDPADTNGQEAIVEGATVEVHLLPAGDATGDKDYNGNVIVTRVNYQVQNEDYVRASFDFEAAAALTITTLP